MRERSFSMIELMVVILIIVVILSLLFPALKHARDNARAAVCLSNQRQILAGSHLYAQDYKDLIPREGHVEDGDRWPVWCVVLRPYLGDETHGDFFEYAFAFHCPARPRDAHIINYVVNGFPFMGLGVVDPRARNSRYRRGPTPLASIQRPSGIVYVSDFGDDESGEVLQQIQGWIVWGDDGVGQFYDVWSLGHLTHERLGFNRHFGSKAAAGRFDGSAYLELKKTISDTGVWDDGLWQLSR